MVEHGAEAEDEGLGFGGVALLGGQGPVVGVVVELGVRDVRGGGGGGEHEDGRGVEDGVCGERSGGEDAAAWRGGGLVSAPIFFFRCCFRIAWVIDGMSKCVDV